MPIQGIPGIIGGGSGGGSERLLEFTADTSAICVLYDYSEATGQVSTLGEVVL